MNSKVYLLVLSLLFSINLTAADRYWIATSASNWNNMANWSTVSGGTGGAAIPSTGNIVAFDGNGTGNCTLDVNTSVAGIVVEAGYTGTITQGSSAITIGSFHALFSGGTFSGGSGDITCNSDLTINGSNFTSTSGILSIRSNHTLSSGTFNHNNGTVLFRGSKTISNAQSFNNVLLEDVGQTIINFDPTVVLTVIGDLTFGGISTIRYDGGNIHAKGDIYSLNGAGGNATLVVNGSGNQNFIGITDAPVGILPNVVIDKPSGLLSLSKQISIKGNWTYIKGDVSCQGTILFYGSKTISGSHTLHKVHFRPAGNTFFTIQISDTLTVKDSLVFDGLGNFVLNGGTICAQGDIISEQGQGGSATICINGTGNQRLVGDAVPNFGRLPQVVINKPSGLLSIDKVVTVRGNWSYLQGAFDLNATGRIIFYGSKTISGKQTLVKASFRAAGNTTITVTDTIIVVDSLAIDGVATLSLNGGVINARGDIISTKGGLGSLTLNIDGSGTQYLTGGSHHLPKAIINKPSGDIILGNDVRVYGLMTFVKGKIISSSNALLIFDLWSSVAGASSVSYVDGPVNKIGYSPFTYPIGKSSNYQPLSISAPSVYTHAFTAEYLDNAQSFGSSLDTGLGSISSCEYWQLDRTTGTSNVSVTLGWNANSCDITQPSDMRVSGWDGMKWLNHGSGAITGNTTTGTVTSAGQVSSYGAFALGNVTATATVDDIDLGLAGSFALLAGGSIAVDNTITVDGDVGAIGAIDNSISATGTVFPSNDVPVQQGLADLNAAIALIESLQGTTLSPNLGGQTLAAGVYDLSGHTLLNDTLSLSGGFAAKYVFRIADSITIDSGATLRLGNVLPQNVYWLVGTRALVRANANFSGIVISKGAIAVQNGNKGQVALYANSGNIALFNSLLAPIHIKSPNVLFQQTPLTVSVTAFSPLGVCGDTSTYTITVTALSDVDSTLISITLPTGVSYVDSSVAIDVDSVFQISSQPDFSIPGIIATGDQVVVSYDVVAGCSAIGPPITVVTQTVDDTLTDTISIISAVLLIPVNNGINPAAFTAIVGDTFQRTITFINTGTDALTTGFKAVDDHGSAIVIDSVKIGVNPISNIIYDGIGVGVNPFADTLVVSAADVVLAGFPNGLTPANDTLILTEYLRVVACTPNDEGQSFITYAWGCGNEVCQSGGIGANVSVPNLGPTLTVLPALENDICYGDSNQSTVNLVFANTGSLPANDVKLELSRGPNRLTDIDTASFKIITSSGDTIDLGDSSVFVLDSFDTDPALRTCAINALTGAFFSLPTIAASDTLVVTWQTRTCCPESCNLTSNKDLWQYRALYQGNLCNSDTLFFPENQSLSNLTGGNDVKSKMSQIFEGPTDMDENEIATFIHINSALELWKGDTTKQLLLKYTLDTGLCYVDSTLFLLSTQGDMWLPSSVIDSTDTGTGGGTVTAVFTFGPLPDPDLNFNVYNALMQQSEFHIDFKAKCDAPPSSRILQEVSYISSTECLTNCIIPMSCDSQRVSIHCPGCLRQGIHFLGYSIGRLNYGEADDNNDGVSEFPNPVDLNLVKSSRAMVGDTLVGRVKTEIRIRNGSFPALPMLFSLRYGYFKTKIGCISELTPLETHVRIYDADSLDLGDSTGLRDTTYEFDIPSNQVFFQSDSSAFIYDFSIDTLHAHGYVPAYYDSFVNRDSVLITTRLKVSGNIGANIQTCFLNNHIYLAARPDINYNTLLDPPSCDTLLNVCNDSDMYYCTKYNGQFNLVGYDNTASPGVEASDSCSKVFRLDYSFGPGGPIPNSGGFNAFPFEYRNFGNPDTAMVKLPKGFTFESARLNHRRTGGTGINFSQKRDGIIPDTIIGDLLTGDSTLVFALAQYFTDDIAHAFILNDSVLYRSDDDFRAIFRVTAKLSCELPDTTITTPAQIGMVATFEDTASDFIGNDTLITFAYQSPDPTLSTFSSNTQNGISQEVCWDVIVTNGDPDATSFNTWVASASNSGNMAITEVFNTTLGVPALSDSGIYQIGDLAPLEAVGLRVCAGYSCKPNFEKDTLLILTGWDCDYPASLTQAACSPSDTLRLFMIPDSAILSTAVTFPDSINICDTIPVSMVVSSIASAGIANIVAEFALPAGGGYAYDSGSAFMVYPTDTVGIQDPVVNGNTFTWQVDSLNSFIRDNGLMGAGSETAPLDSSSVTFLFNLISTCSNQPGNTVLFNSTATSNCGDSLLKVIAKTPVIRNYPIATQKSLSITVDDFSSCDSIATVTIAITNIDGDTTGSSDFFNFVLPANCMSLVGGSFVADTNAPNSSSLVIVGDTLSWQLPSGVDSAGVMGFSFQVSLDNGSCGSGPFGFSGNTSLKDSLGCNSGFCYFEVFGGSDLDSAVLGSPLVATSSGTDVSCNGGNDGTATVSVSGGTAPYTYSWSNGDSTNAADSLVAGTHVVTILDGNSCSLIDSVTITEPTAIAAVLINTDVSCSGGSDGSATVTVNGGIAPYTYLWSNGSSSTAANSLTAGSFYVTITDSNSCEHVDSVLIAAPASLSDTITQNTVSCNGGNDGSATVTVSGGTIPYTYLWSNGSNTSTATGLTAGSANVTISDNRSCVLLDTALITEPNSISVAFTMTEVSCNGGSDGSAMASVSGGIPPYTYLWSNGSIITSASGLAVGTTFLTITDSNSCVFIDSVLITAPALLSGTTSETNISCNGANDGIASVNVSGGTAPYTFIWTNGDNTNVTDSLVAGTSFVKITDSNGCNLIDSVTITEPSILNGSIISSTDVLCNGECNGTATLNAVGGVQPFTYLWDNTESDSGAVALCAATHSVTVTDANGCVDTAVVVINEPAVLIATITDSAGTSCNGLVFGDGSATVGVTGGIAPYNYLWTFGGTDSIYSGISAGTVIVTVTDANGCDTNTSVVISEPPPLAFVVDLINNATCRGAQANGEIFYHIEGGTPPTVQFVNISGQQTLNVPQDSVQFMGNLDSNTYFVTVTDTAGCSINDTFIISGPPILATSIDTAFSSSCSANDGTATANVTGGVAPYTYLWSNGQTTPTINSLSPGSYTITVTDNNGCTATGNAIVDFHFLLTATGNSIICTAPDAEDGTATANVSNPNTPLTFLWSDSQAQITATATGLALGNYSVTVTDANGCAEIASATISPAVTSFDFVNPVITTDTTWSDSLIRVKGTLKINGGVTLTINNSIVEFFYDGDHARVIAQGKLDLTNGILTGPDNCIWEGVSLGWLYYGIIEMENSTIKNAVIGITDNRWPQLGEANLQPQSGYIAAVSSSFVNNRRGVVVGSNFNNSFVNTSTFQKCDFEYNDASPFDYSSGGDMHFVEIQHASDLVFRGNTFENTTPGSFGIDDRGIAIQGYNAHYTVERTCDVVDTSGECLGQRNTFEGLTYGIHMDNIISFNTFHVKGCEFINTRRGVYLGNVYGAKVNRNIFNMPVSQNFSEIPYGIYLDGSTAYEVEENEFFTANVQTFTIGIVVNNSGSSGDELYRNEFHDLGIGIQTQGTSGFNSNQGLRIKCNDFVNPVKFNDIRVSLGDIDDPQGLCDQTNVASPAGNNFSHTCNSPEADIFANSNTSFQYNHQNDVQRTPQASCYSDTEVDAQQCPFGFSNLSCPSQFNITDNPCGFGSFPCNPVLVGLKNDIALLNTTYNSLADGGNTAGLLASIATDPVGQIKNKLLAVSPYVSDETLLAYLSKPVNGKGSVPPGHVKQVVIANSPVTNPVKAATDNRNLPQGIQTQIDAAQTGISPRRELELEITFFERQISLNMNSLSRFFLFDSLTLNGIDSVIILLEQQSENNDRKLQLTEAYIAAERFSEAKSQLDTLDSIGGFDNFSKLQNTVIDIIKDGISFDTLQTDSLLRMSVDSIANDTLYPGYLQARALLSLVFGARFREHIEPLPQQQQLKTSGYHNEIIETADPINKVEIQDIEHRINIYPNPANSTVTINYKFARTPENAILSVYNLLGTKVNDQPIEQKTGFIEHDVSILSEGIYLYIITENQSVIRMEKISVIR